MIDKMTDSDLANQIELHRTRMALFETQVRAAKSEIALAHAGAEETMPVLKALMAEQQKRAQPAPAAGGAAPKPE